MNRCNAWVASYRPVYPQHLLWIRELVDTQWEILRQLRYRTSAIEHYHQKRMNEMRKKIKEAIQQRKDELAKLHIEYGDVGHEQVLGLQKSIAGLEAVLQEIVERKANNDDHSFALEQAAKYVERLDKWLKNAAERRNNLLKILEYFCRQADQEIDIPAARCDAVEQDETKKIAAPSVVPPRVSHRGHNTRRSQRKSCKLPQSLGFGVNATQAGTKFDAAQVPIDREPRTMPSHGRIEAG